MSPVVEEIYNQGHYDGVSKGRAEGRNEGRNEEKILIVKNLFKAGMSIEFIKNITSCTEDQIVEIIEQNQKN